MAGDPIPRVLRREVLELDEHRCQRCGKDVRQLLYYSLQHRRPRGAGGSRHANFLANLITLCGSATSAGGCHAWVENDGTRTLARAQGFLVSQGHDPAGIAVLRFAATESPSWQLRTANGWQLAPAPAVVDTWSATSVAHFEETGEYLTAEQVAALTEVPS